MVYLIDLNSEETWNAVCIGLALPLFDLKMNFLLAGKAALLAVLLYFIANNIPLVVKIIFSLVCLICLYQFQRLMFTRRSVHSSSESHSPPMASQPMKAHKPIELKLAIDKRSNQVLFAESDKDFVDVLLSFLTLPMGTIVRLADKRSGIGCMDELYRSVEDLDDEKFFWTKASKTMLLNPKSAYGFQYHNLVVKIDETDYSKLYTCSSTPCRRTPFWTSGFFSLVKNSVCVCGQAMENEIYLQNTNGTVSSSSSKVFINKADRYIINDDLKLLPLSIGNTLPWLKVKEITDGTEVREEKVNIGVEEVLHLLHCSMVSKTPLKDVFSPKNNNTPLNLFGMPHQHQKDQNGSNTSWMEVKLWFSKSTNRVLCIEAEEGFVNFLLTFLTLPLGAIIKMLDGKSSMGSMDKLYKSAKKLSEMQIIAAEHKDMLLSPKLERMFGCSYQLLQIQEEIMPSSLAYNNCSCWRFQQTKACEHFKPTLYIMNPKWPGVTTGGAFVKGGNLLVTGNLEIKPLSAVSDISKLGNIPFSDMKSMLVQVGEEEALNLLQAALTSKSVLNHAFQAKVINRK